MEKVLQNARYGSPRYRKGEKYCPTCRLVYSAEYANGHCEKCGGALRMSPRFQRTVELSDYDKALLQWLENTYGPGFALRRHALYSIGERRCRTCPFNSLSRDHETWAKAALLLPKALRGDREALDALLNIASKDQAVSVIAANIRRMAA